MWTRCNSESVLFARSAAVVRANSASLEPSVATRILVGKMLIGYRPLVLAVVTSGRYDARDRKSTRLNSSHANISYAVFCLKKKKKIINLQYHTLYLTL